jgi:hypothetical protein
MGDTGALRSYVQAVVGDYNILDTMGLNQASFLLGKRIGVKGVVDELDGWVDENDLAYVLSVIGGLKGKCYMDDTQNPPVKKPAIERFLELYLEDEGENLVDDINSVGTKTLKTGSEKVKQIIINTISTLQSEDCSATEANVDDSGKPTPEPEPTPPAKPKNNPYRDIKLRKIYDDSQIER